MAHTWLITGASQGLGSLISLAALKSGHKVIATARNPQKAAKTNPEIENQGGIWKQLDVTSTDTTATVADLVKQYNVDVLVNNAGYALLGALEDISDEEAHAQMDTNFYGCLRTIRGALPHFREQQRGTIVNVSSGAAFLGMASRGLYSASKAALEAMSEALVAEVRPFNIQVFVIDLGAFRTDFSASVMTPSGPAANGGISEAYKGTPAHQIIEATKVMGPKAPGDAAKAARRIVEIVEGKLPQDHLRLVLGSDSLKRAREKEGLFARNLDAMESIAPSTDVDE